MRIVVIEDEASARRGLVRLIEDLGGLHSQVVGQAADGYQGLALIYSLTPDVAFVDIKMPGMDGLEMIRRVREQGLSTKFVLVSAFAEFTYAQQALRLNVHEYLVKPIAVDDVATVLSRLAPHSEQSAAQSVYHPMVQRTLNLIHEQYRDHINLANISDQLNITPEYLSYLFHRDTGVNFSAYLRNVRIREACELMKGGSAKIYEVARATGFTDAKYFCRVFREVIGQTPGAYMKERGEKAD